MTIRKGFEESLKRLQDDVLMLGSMVEEALVESVQILKNRDFDGSRRLIAYDERVNEKRFAIENSTLSLIALQQPVAADMRTLAAILEIATELERIGDYAKGICNINLMIGEGPLLKPLVDIPRMVEHARDMLHRALEAFVRRDLDTARAIPKEDDVLDNLYNQVYRELLTLIMADPTRMDQATLLLWVAHNLERTGDRIVNICERIVFTITGSMKEMNNSAQ
ncbi:MAG: phosphate transport system regulatory protein PhoU [Chloroflexi bacterium]|nr:MAG: phosphate transport system regulatory protein PhoU [Chloroflexota bacterium]